MNDKTTPRKTMERAAADYFRSRLLAISADVFFFEAMHYEGRVAHGEFIAIRRSLMEAKREVQVALETWVIQSVQVEQTIPVVVGHNRGNLLRCPGFQSNQ